MSNERQPGGPRGPVSPQGPSAEQVLKLRQAFGAHQQGRFVDAERLYREVLAQAPQQPDALHFLGVLEAQRGRHEAGLALMDRAIASSPGNAAMLYNRANVLRQMGRLQQALAGYDDAIAAKRDNFAALNNRGTVLHALQRYKEALAGYDRALVIKPDYAEAHINRGNTLMELNRYDEALASYDRVLASSPKNIEALYGRGNALVKLNRQGEAVLSYDRALALQPDNPQLLNNRGNALCQLSRYEEAIASLDRAIAAAPENAEPFNNRGNALMPLRRYEDALASFDRALTLDAGRSETLYGRASALVELKRHDEAISAFRQLLHNHPDYPYAIGMMVYAQTTGCDWQDDSAPLAMTRAIREGKRAATPLVLLAVSDSASDKLRCAEVLARDKYPPASEPLWNGEKYDHDRIRIVYLSADFRMHPVAILMAGVFENHDRRRFETIAISHGPDDGSEMRSRLQGSFDRFIDVQNKGDRDIAVLIREMEVDIVIDLTGLTASARQGILALRPAPVQVNYLGYAGSFGASHADYILADRVLIPDQQQAFYSEKTAYLPGCYMPHDSKRRIRDGTMSRSAAGLPEQGFVFASFNNSYKFNASMFDVWMRLLRAVPGSILWLPTANPTAMRNLRREAQTRGIDPERIVFAAHLPAAEDHLARLRLADLFLDTLPYNAHTTASDALWAGLPLLTCKGESFAARVAASLLEAVGLPELITDDIAAYEQKALELARNPDVLAAARETLRGKRETCTLFDTARFTRNLERAYEHMWERAQRGEAPASFAVDDAQSAASP